MKEFFRNILLILAFVVSATSADAQLVISQLSNWQEDLDATDLATPEEAGEDLNPTLETASNYNQLDILNVASTQDWKITISKSDINWPGAFFALCTANYQWGALWYV